MSVYVIGAGVTGLTFAKTFGDAGVLESGPAVGGKASSCAVATGVGTFVFDMGGHWFHHRGAADVLGLLDGLPLRRHERKAYVRLRDRLYHFPIQHSYRTVPDPAFVGRVDRELARMRGVRPAAANYDELLLHTYGETLYGAFFRDYNMKMYGRTDLSQIVAGSYEAVRNVPLDNSAGYNHEFWYPEDGRGAMAIPLHLAKGVDVKLNAGVQSIHLKEKLLLVHNRALKWDKLVSTIPLPALAARIADMNPAMLRLSGKLQSSRGFILNLGIKKTAAHHGMDWVYVPGKDCHFYRLGFYSNVQPMSAPDGYSAMYVECSPLFFADKTEAYALIPVILSELIEQGFLRDKRDIAAMQPVYLEHNYCLPDPDITAILIDYLKEHGVYSIGRYGSWHWSSQHEDMRQAINLATELSIGKRAGV